MNKNYFVIHSKDPYLLARFCTELQMEGIRWRHEGYAMFDDAHPFEKNVKWLAKYRSNSFAFYNHDCAQPDLRLTITASNYSEVLQTVLAEKGGEPCE